MTYIVEVNEAVNGLVHEAASDEEALRVAAAADAERDLQIAWEYYYNHKLEEALNLLENGALRYVAWTRSVFTLLENIRHEKADETRAVAQVKPTARRFNKGRKW